MIVNAVKALLVIGEIIAHLEILSWCSGAVSNTFAYFDEGDSIAMVNKHFALTIWDHGIRVAILTGILVAIAGVRKLIERSSTPDRTRDIARRHRITEERIGWTLLLVLPILTYTSSLIFKAEEGPVFAVENRQMAIVSVGFLLMAGVDLKLVKIGFTRGKSSKAPGASVNA